MINFLKIRVVMVLVCLVSITDGISQDLSHHNWYFGNSVNGIRFSRNDNSASLVTNQATPFGIGGSAVVTDPTNGNLVFYTDGTRVFDLTHAQMPDGAGLNATTSANQPVAICPIPGQPTQYYIFTNAGGSIFTTTVDLSLAGTESFPAPPLGNVVAASINTPTGITGRSEAMIIVPHANGTDFWLITHADGTDDYLATLIDATGLFPPTPSPAVTGLPISAANFSYHAGSGKIAVSPKTADRNVTILNFDNASGALLLDQFVLNSGVTTLSGQSIYDTEWSNSGDFLYISRHGEAGVPADVLQYDLNNPGVSLATVLDFVPDRSYGLQMAPDSAIYHLYQATAGGPFLLGRLTNIDTIAASVVDSTEFFGVGLDFNGTQFPAFASGTSATNLSVTFIAEGTCSNSPVTFYPTVTPTADSLVWDFGDGQTSNQWSPIHTYTAGGTFPVRVVAFLNSDSASFSLNVSLTQFDLQLTLVADTTACECELPVNNGVPPCANDTSDDFSVTVKTQGGTPTSFIWSNGDTGPTLTPDSAGYYYVVVTDASGCTAYAGVYVREYDAVDQRANIWYFGENAGINFNAPIAATPGPLNTPEGCSVISDRNGLVIFSTDGVRVYDRNDVEIPIPVPPGIGGESGSTQSALIMPVPGDETLYYIFTTQEVHGSYGYELRYSLYDIKLNGGNGGLAEFNQLLFSKSTERITGNANWLIAHEYGNNSFRAYQITLNGIGNPVISSIGSDHQITDEFNGQGYMELGGQNQLVVALPSFDILTNDFTNVLEFFDFDNTTGIVSNFRSVDLNVTDAQVYGVEISGNKIFASLRGSQSYLRELYFDYEGNPVLIPPAGTSIPAEIGAIQTGPDGRIYVAVNDQGSLGEILLNGDTLQLSNFTLSSFPLNGGVSKLGLPNFIQNVGVAPQLAGMTVTSFCLGDTTDFSGTGTDAIDEFEWSFGDGFGANTQVAEHVYAAIGTYLVTLRVTNRCGLDTLITRSITIVAPPANPTFLPIGQQPVLCTGALTLEAEPAPPSPGYTYVWSNGDSTRTTIISQQSVVSVVITNAQGCTSNGSIIVADNRPQVDLGPDQTLCQNLPLFPLDAQNPGAEYEWFLDDAANGNITQTQSVSTVVADIFEYKVEVTDPITLCIAKDSIVFTINASPVFTAVPTNTTGCGMNDGQIALNIISPANTFFTYLIAGISTGTNLQDIDQVVGPVLPVFAPLMPDTYVIQVTDQVSGCASITSIAVDDNTISIIAATPRTPTCDPVIVDVQTMGIISFVGATYSIVNSATGVQTVPPTTLPAANFFTVPIPVPGDYIIQINADGCVATFPVNIVSDPQVVVSFVTDICNATVTAQGGTIYDWSRSPIGSISSVTDGVAIINPGTWNLIVEVDDGVNCTGVGNITVTVEPDFAPDFTASDACEDLVTLSATPVGSFTYLWRNITDGTTIIGGSSIIVSTTENLDNFRVVMRSTVTGCSDSSSVKQVFVAGDLQLTMATTVPCSGSPFTLTGTSNIPGTGFQWGVDGTDIFGETQPTLVDQTEPGLYRLTGSLPGCTEFIEQQIILFPNIPGSLPNLALICPNPANPDPDTREVLLDAGAGFTNYEWYQNDVLSTNTGQTFLAFEEAIYRVELISPFGCPSTDQTEVREECNPRIIAPTAFRPGSSVSQNSSFFVFTYFVAPEDFQLFIFNRWGEIVYQSNGLVEELDLSKRSQSWNGGYNNNAGQILPAGTYSYIVKYKSAYRPQDGVQEKRGGVVLLR
jgi:PKD repeat protein